MNKIYDKILKTDILKPILAHKQNGVWKWVTRGDFNNMVNDKMNILYQCKVEPSHRVMYQGKNSIDYVAWNLATWKVGAVWVPIYGGSDTDFYINNCKPKLFVNENKIKVLSDATETTKDLACLVYTSGTSGEPKGVMLSHSNLVSNINSLQKRFSEFSNLTALNILPWHHIYSLTTELHYNLLSGNRVVVSSGKEHFIPECREIKPDILYVVPKVLETIKMKLVNYSFLTPLILKTLFGGKVKTIFVGGAKLDDKTKVFYLSNGINLCEGYGSTECSPMVSVNHIKTPRNINSVGKILDDVSVEIVDNEIQVSGPNVMMGYWGCDDVLVRRGSKLWYRTGDMGQIKDDFLFYDGRIKDTYKLSNGKFCNPVTIESVIKAQYNHNFIVYGENRPYNILISDQYVNLNELNKDLDKYLHIKKVLIVDFTKYLTSKLSIKRKLLINDNFVRIEGIYTEKN